MSRRKRVLLGAGLLVALAGAGFTALVLLQPHSPINLENFEKIRVGMREREVTDILGVPADHETGFAFERGTYKEWNGTRYSIMLDFDRYGRVTHRWFAYSSGTAENLLDRLRRWLGL
jgi:hypothetical protein